MIVVLFVFCDNGMHGSVNSVPNLIKDMYSRNKKIKIEIACTAVKRPKFEYGNNWKTLERRLCLRLAITHKLNQYRTPKH